MPGGKAQIFLSEYHTQIQAHPIYGALFHSNNETVANAGTYP